jgi:hypothetical protein
MLDKKLEVHSNIVKNMRPATIKEIYKLLKDRLSNDNLPIYLHKFDVLFHGWECDPDGWIVEVDNERLVILTDHGSSYIATTKELKERLKYYRTVIEATEKAIAIVKMS